MANILPVANNGLILTSWGMSVANELNTNVVKKTAAQTMAGPLTLTGLLTANAQIVISDPAPTAVSHAVRKDYVDPKFAQVVGETFVGAVTISAGGTNGVFTGTPTSRVLILRSQLTGAGGAYVDVPYIEFQSHTAVQLATIQASVDALNLTAATGDVNITAGGVNNIVLNTGGGQVRSSDALYVVAGGARIRGGAAAILGTGSTARLDLYGASTSVDAPGARNGFVGYNGDGHMRITNEGASASIFHNTDFAHGFLCNSVEAMRIQTGQLVLIGKTASGLTTGGVELFGGTGVVYSTVDTNTPNVILNRQGGGDVDEGIWLSFRNNNSEVGNIHWDTGTSKTVFKETSDYRLKNDLGPVTDAVERIMALNPRRITRKDSPAPVEHDALIAHEVAEVMPELVSGEKDAVAGPPATESDPPEGAIIPQGLNYGGLMTVTIAALQEALAEIESLKTRIATLEAAA